MLDVIVKSGKFNVTAVTRASSSATFPSNVTVKKADMESVDSVKAVFEGQDAVVSTVGMMAISAQSVLIDAAVAAGVKRFLPSDFGCDLANPKGAAMPIFKQKLEIHKALREAAAAHPSFSYSLVCNNAFLDWGIEKNFLINWKEDQPKLFDGGKTSFTAATLATVGQAIVGVLEHPEETKDRFVYCKDIDISQLDMLAIAKKVDPNKKYQEPIDIDTAAVEKSSYGALASGHPKPEDMYGFLIRIIFGPPEYGTKFTQTDNELLGIKEKSLADVEAIFKRLV